MGVKKMATMSRDTYYSDEYRNLSPEAKDVYVGLLFNAESTGQLYQPERTIVGYSESVMRELLDAGLILDCDGETFMTNAWVDNKYDSRWLKRLDGCDAYRSGRLGFEGEVGRSRYVLNEVDLGRPDPDRTDSSQCVTVCHSVTRNSNSNNNSKHNDNLSKSSPSQNVYLRKGGVGGNPSNSIWTTFDGIPFENAENSFNENEPINEDAVLGTEMQPGDLTNGCQRVDRNSTSPCL